MNGLNGRVKYQWGLKLILISIIFSMITRAVSQRFEFVPTWISIIGLFLLVLSGIAVISFHYRSWNFQIESNGIFIECGFLWRKRTFVPHHNIQHVDINQPIIDRLFGLSRLVIHTAGEADSTVRISGLRPDKSKMIEEEIFNKKQEDS
ncbi:PH domain-containing protein [Haloterrigena salifodinae]|uniref:PH domain-containing protein n=1 Tax=Haloterrigena salifodinae TaxID=2675099 RepID=UPI000F866326